MIQNSPVLTEIYNFILKNELKLQEWFNNLNTKPHIYTSVDIRHSGDKIAPVDTNLFPAGFNNLNTKSRSLATDYFKSYLKKYFPNTHSILVIGENHTRNLFYLDNLYTIGTLLNGAGFEVRFANTSDEEGDKIDLTSQEGNNITINFIQRRGNALFTKDGFKPDIILLNNDLTSGIPEALKDVNQPIIPSPHFGWHIRRKSEHFKQYNNIVTKLYTDFPEIDPFYLTTEFGMCDNINFKHMDGMDRLNQTVETLLTRLEDKYKKYGIKQGPYLFIKADNGTYGMGMMTVSSTNDLTEMNKKLRNKMAVIKEGYINSSVIIQEGIPTIDRVDDNVAEPMLYLVAGKVVGCMYRVNTNKDQFTNLNSQGMYFKNTICLDSKEQNLKNRFMVFGFIARLAALAASYEKY
jgi:glutamate--cysteine ligase